MSTEPLSPRSISPMLTVGIVDDHLVVRNGLREMLTDELNLQIAFEAGSGEAALEHLKLTPCNVMLLDLSLPGKSGIDVLREMQYHHPDVKVLILSGFSEDRYARAMLRSGADGYLCKDCTREDLIKAIHTVAAGRKYISSKTAEFLAESMGNPFQEAKHENLSKRELQVFLRLCVGKSVGDISTELNLSVKTISTYRARLLEKLEVGSNAELATYAIRHGLIRE